MPRGEVLVAVVNNLEDMTLAREVSWYRIPVASVRKWLRDRWPPRWLAFYQTKVFGPEAHAVNYYAVVRDIREEVFDFTLRRAWKGFRFEALDVLEETGYINQTRRAKSVTLTEAGCERARALATKYLGDRAEGEDNA